MNCGSVTQPTTVTGNKLLFIIGLRTIKKSLTVNFSKIND